MGSSEATPLKTGKELLLEMHEKNITEQKRILHEAFINWKGKQPQVDDMLAVGIEII